ncbi:MAG: B12-binding domain-containing radical SAM protein [Candidatus Thorarchaeota archaeon]
MVGRVLIVDALSAGSGRRTSSRDSIGCGPRTVGGVLERHEVPCRIARAEEIAATPKKMRSYEHLAITAMTMDLPVTQSIVQKWRRTNPVGRVVIGGPLASDSTKVLRGLKPDVLVVGEGEGTLNDLLELGFFEDETDCSNVQGIGYFQGKKPIINPLRPPLSPSEISEIFVPSTTRIVDYATYQASKVYVEVLRGCSNFKRTTIPLPDGRECTECDNCESDDPEERQECPENIPAGCGFCSVPSTWGPPRSRSPESIEREVRELLDLGVHRIVLEAPDFLDYYRGTNTLTNPCEPPANIDAISDLIRRLAALETVEEGDVHISVENVKACLFTEEVASVLSTSMRGISPNIGVETGSDEHMRRIGKCGSTEDVLTAVRTAVAYGMSPFVYLIYGLPGETPETIQDSIHFMHSAAKAGAQRIILYGFRALPGSAFSDLPEPEYGDPAGVRLRREAASINRARKRDYVAKRVRGIAAEPSWEQHGYTMFYPLEEGPLITVKGGFSAGTVRDIVIRRVLSSGLVEGDVVSDTMQD